MVISEHGFVRNLSTLELIAMLYVNPRMEIALQTVLCDFEEESFQFHVESSTGIPRVSRGLSSTRWKCHLSVFS
jgi:hypothetical protein